MATPAGAGNPSRTGTSLFRDPRKWITLAVGVVVVVAGIVLVWPKGGPEEVPDDLCAAVGKETLAKYVPDPKVLPDKIGTNLAYCKAKSPSDDFRINIELSRDEDSDESFTDLCHKLKSREEMKPEDLIKPSETAEFGNQMCGWISAVRNKSGLGSLPNHSTIHVIDGENELFIMYDGGAGSRSHQLRRTLDLTRSILAKLR
ncbi:hypothetical protein ACIRPT_06015 [Streptomyces sp. NPDC101227]|uniref:hypothetical protein n=1 Tax=Streptomyces sp. NPDC101227 TaxID=3366136 RepID=UPI00381C75FA